MGNPLEEYFRNNEGRLIHKWMHYFEVYHRHFERFRNRPVTIVEFGVNQGGSLEMWRDYFGPEAAIVGIDIDPRCQQFEGDGITIMIGDQEDRDFLRRISAEVGPIDVVIEDGGHTMGQQIATFEVLYSRMTDDGCFLVEDVHTSYWERYGGGLRREGTFMELAKQRTDQLNAWHAKEDEELQVNGFTRTTKSIHFYDSIVVFERGKRSWPKHRVTGEPTFREFSEGLRLDQQ